MAELLGKQVEDTNTKAERNSIRLLLSQQPIEIICRLKTDESQKDNRGGRRYPSKLYPRDSVLAFLDACSPEYLGVEASDTLRKIDLQRLAIKAFDHFARHMDTSPFRARLRELGGAMNVVQLVVGESGLPGFPRAVATDNPRVDNLLRHMVLDADKGVLLRDRGLAELLGKQAKHVNRDAEEKKVDHAELNQPIEITLDHGSSASSTRPQGGGPSNRFYASDQVGAFLEKSAGPDDPQPYLPAPREELKAAVAAAFEHFETRVDTNPFRQRSRRLAKAQAVNQAKAEGARLLTSWPGPDRDFNFNLLK